jgi:hypothetical protein
MPSVSTVYEDSSSRLRHQIFVLNAPSVQESLLDVTRDQIGRPFIRRRRRLGVRRFIGYDSRRRLRRIRFRQSAVVTRPVLTLERSSGRKTEH